jgi:opacity protein-like surface antigen
MKSLMSRLIALSFALFVCSSAAQAADLSDRWRISILASEMSNTHEPWSDLHAGVGIAVAYELAKHTDLELTASNQTYRAPYLTFIPNFQPEGGLLPVTIFRRYRVLPVDLTLTRHFLTTSRVSPYVRGGVRYVDAPSDPGFAVRYEPVPGSPYLLRPTLAGGGFADRTSFEAGGGLQLNLTSRTALRFEAMRLLRSQGVDYDPLTRFAAGVSWKF